MCSRPTRLRRPVCCRLVSFFAEGGISFVLRQAALDGTVYLPRSHARPLLVVQGEDCGKAKYALSGKSMGVRKCELRKTFSFESCLCFGVSHGLDRKILEAILLIHQTSSSCNCHGRLSSLSHHCLSIFLPRRCHRHLPRRRIGEVQPLHQPIPQRRIHQIFPELLLLQ